MGDIAGAVAAAAMFALIGIGIWRMISGRIPWGEFLFVHTPPDLWNGETVQLDSAAFMLVGSEGAPVGRGWLYLTDFRLIWMPSVPKQNLGATPLPIGEPVEVGLGHIQGLRKLPWSAFHDGFRFEAAGEDFIVYTNHQFGELPNPRLSSKQWLAALGATD